MIPPAADESLPPAGASPLDVAMQGPQIYRTLAAHLPGVAVMLFDRDLRFLLAEGGALHENGFVPEQMLGRTLAETVSPEALDELEPLYRRALAGQDVHVDHTSPMTGGTFATTLTPVRGDDGSVVGGMIRVEDVTERRRTEAALVEGEARWRGLFDASPMGTLLASPDGRILAANDELGRIVGRAPGEVVGLRIADLVHPEERSVHEGLMPRRADPLEGQQVFHRRVQTLDGQDRTVRVHSRAIGSGSGATVLAHVVDVTEATHLDRERAEALAFQQAVLAASPDLIAINDLVERRNVWSSRSLESMLGYGPEEMLHWGAELAARLLPVQDRPAFEQVLEQVRGLADGEVVKHRVRVLHADGEVRWLSSSLTPFHRDAAGALVQYLVVSRDVTEVVAMEARLEQAALHDELTGLPNRRLVVDRLEHALARFGRTGLGLAVLFCDLDGFKRVNDSLGHASGDAVLVAAARCLQGCVRASDSVGRIGGDEFVVVLESVAGEDLRSRALRVAERITAELSQPVEVARGSAEITVSIGIAFAQPAQVPEESVTAEQLLHQADMAMYEAKARGKDRHALFESTLAAGTALRLDVERTLRRSLAEHTLAVHHQPVVDPRSGQCVGTEALLRVPAGDAPDGGFLDAALAVSVAEQAGLIERVGIAVMRVACEQTRQWRQQPGLEQLTLAINVSAREVSRPGFLQRVVGALEASRLDAGALMLEITESVLLEATADTVRDFRALRERGVGLAIDDFGTGYGSLRYLATLPVTAVKVDKSFTAALLTDPVSATILRATAGLAQDLGLTCVVEGVESAAQLAALPTGDHMRVQGYLFGRPTPPGVLFGQNAPGDCQDLVSSFPAPSATLEP